MAQDPTVHDQKPKPTRPLVHNEVADLVVGPVVQAGTITGDVNLHAPTFRPVGCQLPASPRWFTGRAEELAALTAALEEAADAGGTLVISAVKGTGGIGKTSLALHWARQHQGRFPDGQLFVNLRGFDPVARPLSSETAIRGFLYALGIDSSRIPDDPEAQGGLYRSLVVDRRLLIMLDNAADTEQVLPLLPGSSSCTVIVTSRHQLTGLVTTHETHTLSLNTLADAEAEELLAKRMGADRVAAEPVAARELLAYCDGLPLALGILAARAVAQPHLPLSDLAAELRESSTRLAALDGGDPRSSLMAVFSWSYGRLSAEAAELFCLLGLASGPDISLAPAASLAGWSTYRVRRLLGELDRASLVHQYVPGRWRMHDLVKLFAAERARCDFREGVAEGTALRRLVDFYQHTALEADHLLAPYKRPIKVDPPAHGCVRLALEKQSELRWFDAEHQCLLAAQQLAMAHGWFDSAWRLAWALTDYQRWEGHLHDYVTTWQIGLEAARRWGDWAAQAWAHRQLGQAFSRLGRYGDAFDHLQQALPLAEQADDALCQAATRRTIARNFARQRDDRQALAFAVDALDRYLTLDTPVWEAIARTTVSWCHARLGNYEDANTHGQIALALHTECDNGYGEAESLGCLGYIAQQMGHYADAATYHCQAAELFQHLRNMYKQADALSHLGEVYAVTNPKAAPDVLLQAHELYQTQHRSADAKRVQQYLAGLVRKPR